MIKIIRILPEVFKGIVFTLVPWRKDEPRSQWHRERANHWVGIGHGKNLDIVFFQSGFEVIAQGFEVRSEVPVAMTKQSVREDLSPK